MRLVCSYCRKVIRHDAGTRILDVSHGMCPSCAEHFGRLWDGMTLSEYLETLAEPVVVTTGDGRIIGANRRLAGRLGRAPAELCGELCGEAFACVHSRLAEGCGRTVHCRECTIRRLVARVHDGGKAARNVPAWVLTHDGRVDLRISASEHDGLVKIVVDEMRAPVPVPAEA